MSHTTISPTSLSHLTFSLKSELSSPWIYSGTGTNTGFWFSYWKCSFEYLFHVVSGWALPVAISNYFQYKRRFLFSFYCNNSYKMPGADD